VFCGRFKDIGNRLAAVVIRCGYQSAQWCSRKVETACTDRELGHNFPPDQRNAKLARQARPHWQVEIALSDHDVAWICNASEAL